MTAFICLLRGVNVGGARKIPMPELQAAFHGLGLTDARTCINSGNVVFSSDLDAITLRQCIEAEIQGRFGYPVGVLVQSLEQLESSLANCPLGIDSMTDPARVLVHFLFDDPAEGSEARIVKLLGGGEEVGLIGRALYIHYRDGVAISKLNGPALNRALGVLGTARNLNTLRKLAEMARML